MLPIEQNLPRYLAFWLIAFSLTAGLVASSSCKKENKPALDKPASWDKYGLSFQYPSNWKVGDELDRGDGIEIVTIDVESKSTWDSSSAIVQTFEPALPATFDVLAEQYLGALPEALDESGMLGARVVEEQPVTYTILGQERAGKRVQIRGKVDGEERDIISEFHVVEQGNRTLVVQTQAPITELEASSAVFAMIRATLATRP